MFFVWDLMILDTDFVHSRMRDLDYNPHINTKYPWSDCEGRNSEIQKKIINCNKLRIHGIVIFNMTDYKSIDNITHLGIWFSIDEAQPTHCHNFYVVYLPLVPDTEKFHGKARIDCFDNVFIQKIRGAVAYKCISTVPDFEDIVDLVHSHKCKDLPPKLRNKIIRDLRKTLSNSPYSIRHRPVNHELRKQLHPHIMLDKVKFLDLYETSNNNVFHFLFNLFKDNGILKKDITDASYIKKNLKNIRDGKLNIFIDNDKYFIEQNQWCYIKDDDNVYHDQDGGLLPEKNYNISLRKERI